MKVQKKSVKVWQKQIGMFADKTSQKERYFLFPSAIQVELTMKRWKVDKRKEERKKERKK